MGSSFDGEGENKDQSTIDLLLQPCKTLFIKMPDFENVQGNKKNKRRIYETPKLDVKIFPCQKLIACNRSAIFLHVRNQLLAIGWPWWWEVCFEGMEVKK